MDGPSLSSLSVIFVLGGPGAGKGTQCSLLAEKHGFTHLSLGDVLRAEIGKPGSKYASIIEDNMREGRVGPMEITVELLGNAIRERADRMSAKAFLVDGFPRKLDQAILFEETLCAPTCVLVLECADSVLRERLHKRARSLGRFDDNATTIGKRLQTFRTTTNVVLDRYAAQEKLVRIDAERETEVVMANIEKEVLPTLLQEI